MPAPTIKRKATGRPFPPGVSGNPKGPPPVDPALKLVRNLTQEQLAEIGKLMLDRNYDQLEAMANSPTCNVLLAIVGGSLVKAARTQDWEKVETLMIRILGAPRQTVDVNVKADSLTALVGEVAGKLFGQKNS